MKLYIGFEITLLILSLMVPRQNRTRTHMTCSREASSVVRSLFYSKWAPVFEKFKVSVPLECPFHQSRDVFRFYNQAKTNRKNNRWICNLCRKIFATESQLEYHLTNKHHDELLWDEDSICLADFCDIFRCDVHDTLSKMKSLNETSAVILGGTSTTALVKTGPRHLVPCVHFPWGYQYPACVSPRFSPKLTNVGSRYTLPAPQAFSYRSEQGNASSGTCSGEGYANSNLENKAEVKGVDLLMSRLREQQHKCSEEVMNNIRAKCERLVHTCIGGLLLNLTNQEYLNLEAELNRAVCWYLHCNRYWQEVWQNENPRPDGLVLLVLLVVFFTAGLSVSYCVVCVLCDDTKGYSQDLQLSSENGVKDPIHPVQNFGPSPQVVNSSIGKTLWSKAEVYDCDIHCKHKFYEHIEDEDSIV